MPEHCTVTIVARTRINDDRVCVGAMAGDGKALRLMTATGFWHSASQCLFQVGEQWALAYSPCLRITPPHVEDVAVVDAKKVGAVSDMVAHVLKAVKPCACGIGDLFEKKIQFTSHGAGFISRAHIPSCSVGFWVPYCDLRLQNDDFGKPAYYALGDYRHLTYVGVRKPLEFIDAKRLVRVSLARWWKPEEAEPSTEERCYAQISGWY